MTLKLHLPIFALFVLFCGQSFAASPVALKTEALVGPLALDTQKPRFSWRLETGRPGARQAAFHVQVATSAEKLDAPDLWDSGWVESDANVWNEYAGKPLAPFQQFVWRVRLREENGSETAWSQPARAEMGPLAEADWQKAAWLKTPDYAPDTSEASETFIRHAITLTDSRARRRLTEDELTFGKQSLREHIRPLPLLRREFDLPFEPVRVRAYLSAVGYADLRVNGEPATGRVMDPAYTHYPARRLFSTIDLTGKLKKGKNALGISLGSGWAESFYNFRVDAIKGIHYGRPEARLLVLAEGSNGERAWLTTDDRWKTTEGPVRRSHLFLGEQFDARLLPDGWDRPGFDDSKWSAPQLGKPFTGALAAMQSPPERVVRTLQAVKRLEPAPGVFVFEFPEIATGWARLKVRNAKPGQTIVLRPVQTILGEPWKVWTPIPAAHLLHYDHVEKPVAGLAGLDNPFEITSRKNKRECAAAALYTYTCRGGALETWTPRFTYHPFRYVEVIGYPGKPEIGDITAEEVHTDFVRNGAANPGDVELDRLRDTFLRTAVLCCHGVIADNANVERGGYAGEAHGTLSFLRGHLDMYQFVEKHLQDFKAQTTPDSLPHHAPSTSRGGGVWIMDFKLDVPMNIWDHHLHYGDPRTVESFYPVMELMMNRFWELTGGNLDQFSGIGDWQEPRHPGDETKKAPWADRLQIVNSFAPLYTSIELSVGAFWVGSADATADFARRLGKAPSPWLKMRDTLRARLRERFFKDGGFGSVCGDVLALAFGLAESEAEAKQVAADLNRRTLEDWQGHPGLGQTVLHEIAVQLGRYGYADTAKQLYTIKGYPSFWSNLEPPRTTLSPGWKAQYSRQVQQAQSRAGLWFTQGLAGIRPDPQHPGFKHFFLAPQFPTGHPSASATVATAQGDIVSAWKRERDSIVWNVTVPWNTTATVKFPDGRSEQIAAGKHQFTIKSKYQKGDAP